MTIAGKLYVNMIVTCCGLAAVGSLSLGGMKYVQSKLHVLTKRSTPYQVKTLELQGAFQDVASTLLKAPSAPSAAELTKLKAQADHSLGELRAVDASLSAIRGGDGAGTSAQRAEGLQKIGTELFAALEQRLGALDEVRTAETAVAGRLGEVRAQLRNVDDAMGKLQSGSMRQVSTANDGVKTVNQRMKNVQAAMANLSDVRAGILEVAGADDKAALTLAKSHLNVALKLLLQSAFVKAEKDTSAVRSLVDGVNNLKKLVFDPKGLLEQRTEVLATPGEESRKRFTEVLGHANQTLSQIMVLMGDVVEKAAETFTAENSRFDEALKGSATASDVLSANTRLAAAGADVGLLAQQLFSARSTKDLEALGPRVEEGFRQAAAAQAQVLRVLGASRKDASTSTVRAVGASFEAVRGLIFAPGGAMEKLSRALATAEQVAAAEAKLSQLLAEQRAEGNQGVTAAQEEQAKAVAAVNGVFRTSITAVSAVVLGVLVLSIVFGLGLRRSIRQPIAALGRFAAAFGAGDFRVRLDDRRKDEFGTLAVDMNHATDELKGIIQRIRGAIATLSAGSTQLSATASNLSQGVTDQAGQTEQAASSMTELATTVTEVAHNAGTAADASKEALGLANTGRSTVEHTVEELRSIAASVIETAGRIGQLGESSKQITSFVELINGIADQTNLLSLNAAIEAARAGDAGRGFAVVADEVRKLAEHTSAATMQISTQVGAIQRDTALSVDAMDQVRRKVEEGVSSGEEASRSLEAIVGASSRSMGMVDSIARASGEQARAVDQVSLGMDRIAAVTREAETHTSEIRRSAESLASLALVLEQTASFFKDGAAA